MVGDPSLLALVLDDPLAPRVLAWWSATKAGSRCLKDGALCSDDHKSLCRVTETSPQQLAATLERCKLAGLFEGEDGGISDTASKWLRSLVAEQLGHGPQAPKKLPKKLPKKT